MEMENVVIINIPESIYMKIAMGICHHFCLPKGEVHDFKNNLVHFIPMRGGEFEDKDNLYKVTFVDHYSSSSLNIFCIERRNLCLLQD